MKLYSSVQTTFTETNRREKSVIKYGMSIGLNKQSEKRAFFLLLFFFQQNGINMKWYGRLTLN